MLLFVSACSPTVDVWHLSAITRLMYILASQGSYVCLTYYVGAPRISSYQGSVSCSQWTVEFGGEGGAFRYFGMAEPRKCCVQYSSPPYSSQVARNHSVSEKNE